jgi:hypothetical protein
MNDRRRAQRVPVDVAVRYRRHSETTEHTARIENISRSGLLLIAEESIPEGTRLRIAFEGPDGTSHAIVGEVVHTAPTGRVGLTLVHLEEVTLRYVRDVLGVT